jgi:hypothetical protein
METATASAFGELRDWQSMLDRHAELFSEMLPGSSVGFVPRAGSGIQPGKHVAGLLGSGNECEMMAWEVGSEGMRASLRSYAGYEDAKVDLLFVAEDAAIAALRGALQGDTLSIVKRQIRQGAIMFYVMRTKYELQDAGYEEFLDGLGLAFLGACR